MPNYNKINFVEKEREDFKKYFIEAKKQEIKILQSCVKYGKRPPASEILKNQIFDFQEDSKALNFEM